MNNFNYVLKNFVDWIFRRRSFGVIMIKSGIGLMIASLAGGIIARVSYQRGGASFHFEVDSADAGIASLSILSFCVALCLIVIGVWREWLAYKHETARIAKRRVIIIEQRGLRDTTDSPLINYIPDSFQGQRVQLLNDIRERIQDGKVSAPEVALEKICFIKRELESRIGRTDLSDIDIIYGGLFPVPFTFLTGMILDDENKIVAFDWDRIEESWRPLDAEDDGDRFIADYDSTHIKDEIVIAISISYRVDLENIKLSFPEKPVLHLHLAELSNNNHWSKDKQDALAYQFFEQVKNVMNKGVKKIHLIIAGQNSVVFRLGRMYDKRNLPDAIVYQYERSQNPAYPWGVRLPTHGVKHPYIAKSFEEDLPKL